MQKYATYRPILLPESHSVRVISYLSYLSSNSFWKEEALKTCQQNAAIYHHLAGWNEQKMLLCENKNNLSNRELNCVLE